MKNLYILMTICTMSLIITGCSVMMAASQPDQKDITLFAIGTSRSMLLAEFGEPALTEERNGKTYEMFQFTQGYSSGAKAGRVLFHVAADVLTGGMWEIVGTPMEVVFDGNNLAFEVSYDKNNRIESVIHLKKPATK